MVSVTATVDEINLNIDAVLEAKIRQVLESEGDQLVEFLAENSPRGVSATSTALFSNWTSDVPEELSDRLLLEIQNAAPEALQRIAGAAPGTSVDVQELDRWVRGILGINDPRQRKTATFFIARSIQAIGTERFRSGENVLDIDVNTEELGTDSPVFDAVEKIESGINRIEIRA